MGMFWIFVAFFREKLYRIWTWRRWPLQQFLKGRSLWGQHQTDLIPLPMKNVSVTYDLFPCLASVLTSPLAHQINFTTGYDISTNIIIYFKLCNTNVWRCAASNHLNVLFFIIIYIFINHTYSFMKILWNFFLRQYYLFFMMLKLPTKDKIILILNNFFW